MIPGELLTVRHKRNLITFHADHHPWIASQDSDTFIRVSSAGRMRFVSAYPGESGSARQREDDLTLIPPTRRHAPCHDALSLHHLFRVVVSACFPRESELEPRSSRFALRSFWGYSLTFSSTGSSFIGDLRHFGFQGVLEQPIPGANNKVRYICSHPGESLY